ncbi:MAG: peptidoglycan-binding protein [Cyanobacteriota bacterium]
MFVTLQSPPAITDLQKKTIRGIVNIFETGKVLGDYSKVTLLPGDPGHLTYGRSQTTLASGNLYFLIKSYCLADGKYSSQLRPYLDRLANTDLTLDNDMTFRQLLKQAGTDPVMQKTQDDFFDRAYLDRAFKRADDMGIYTPLGKAVVYDSYVHGSFNLISNKTTNLLGKSPAQAGETNWVLKYIEIRKDWLANHANKILHKTVYRMNTFLDLIKDNKWDLKLPIKVHGRTISDDTFETKVPDSPRTDDKFLPLLRLKIPYMTGKYVTKVQEALINKGYDVKPDSVFGPKTDLAVRKFQGDNHLVKDGIVGQQTYEALGIA